MSNETKGISVFMMK